MSKTTFTERQLLALQNPTDRSEGQVIRPHPTANRRHGKWSTTLEVGKLPWYGWLWMASVARQRGPGRNPYKVGSWKAEWFPEADQILADLLDGVGDDPIDAAALMGDNFDKRLAGYHSWRTMTPEEIARLGTAHTQNPEGATLMSTGEDWKRKPTAKRVHFTCAGNINIMTRVPACEIRDGDTVTAVEDHPDKPFLWRAKLYGDLVEWIQIEPWTKDRLRPYLEVADQVAIIAGPLLRPEGSS